MKTLTMISILLLALSGCGTNGTTSDTTPPQPPANIADDIKPPASPDLG